MAVLIFEKITLQGDGRAGGAAFGGGGKPSYIADAATIPLFRRSLDMANGCTGLFLEGSEGQPRPRGKPEGPYPQLGRGPIGAAGD